MFSFFVKKDEYLKAYYAAIHQRQKEQEESLKMEQDLLVNNISDEVDPSNSRKRKHHDDGEGDVEWEETPTAAGRNQLFLSFQMWMFNGRLELERWAGRRVGLG